jgi:hypothetical protein
LPETIKTCGFIEKRATVAVGLTGAGGRYSPMSLLIIGVVIHFVGRSVLMTVRNLLATSCDWPRLSVLVGLFCLGANGLLSSGCAHHRNRPQLNCTTSQSCPAIEYRSLETISIHERQLPTVWSLNAVNASPILDEQASLIRTLTAAECEALASQSSKAANQLLAEQSVSQQSSCSQDFETILNLQANQQRNLSAGLALEAYYQLLGVYLGNGIVQESLQKLSDAQASLEALSVEMPVGDALAELKRERLELLAQLAQFRYQQQALVAQLEFYLVLTSAEEQPIWTNGVVLVEPQRQDLEKTLATAFANRADLAAAETLANSREPTLLAAAKQGLMSSGGGWSELNLPKPLMVCMQRWQQQLAAWELSARHDQLCQLANDLRLAIRLEVTEAWEDLQQQLTILAVKQQVLTSAEQSLVEQEKAQAVRAITPAEELKLHQARLKAKADVIQATIAAQLAAVKLRKSQGLLGQTHTAWMPSSSFAH